MSHDVAYKVLTAEQFACFKRDGTFFGAQLDIDHGFIHLSSTEQLPSTVDKHFRDQINLTIVAVDLLKFDDEIKWERSQSGKLYPHLYGVLSFNAVLSIETLNQKRAAALPLPPASNEMLSRQRCSKA